MEAEGQEEVMHREAEGGALDQSGGLLKSQGGEGGRRKAEREEGSEEGQEEDATPP
jgi:hypothetical protein